MTDTVWRPIAELPARTTAWVGGWVTMSGGEKRWCYSRSYWFLDVDGGVIWEWAHLGLRDAFFNNKDGSCAATHFFLIPPPPDQES